MGDRPKLLVFGTTHNQVPLVRRAQALGYEAWATATGDASPLEGVADRLLPIDTSEKEALLDVVQREDIRGAVTCGTSTPILTIAWITERLGLSSRMIPYEVALDATLKGRTRERLAPLGLVPPGFATDDADEAWQQSEHLTFPVVCKPADGGGGRGISIVRTRERASVLEAFTNAATATRGTTVIVEAFIEGTTCGVEAITLDGTTHVLAVPEKVMVGHPHCVTAGLFFPSPNLAPHHEAVVQANEATIRALGIRWGPTHIDMVVTAEGRPYVIDVGPRLAGGPVASDLIPAATGYDLYGATIRLAVGEDAEPPNPPAPSPHQTFGSHFVVRDQGGVLAGIDYDPALLEASGFRGFRLLRREGDAIRRIERDGDRLAVFHFGPADHEAIRSGIDRFEESFRVRFR